MKKIFYKCTDSVMELMAYYFGLIVASSFVYGFFEGKGWFDSIWWAVVTSMTVGYGDMYPVTVGGRIVAMTLMIVMAFLILPMLIAKMITILSPDRNEFSHEEQEQIKNLLTKIAERV